MLFQRTNTDSMIQYGVWYLSLRRTFMYLSDSSWFLILMVLIVPWVAVATETAECSADGRCSTSPQPVLLSSGNNQVEMENKLPSSRIRHPYERLRDNKANETSCGLYMAESSIAGAGWGVFAGHDAPKGSALLNGTLMDVVLQFVDGREQADLQAKLFGPKLPRLLFRSYFWKATETHAYFDADEVDSIVPGLGMLANSHLGLVNLEQRGCRSRGSSSRRASPTAGATSSYHDCDFVTTRSIPAGHELFVDYGDAWFAQRPTLFGTDVPLTADYQFANRMVKLWQVFVHHRTFQRSTNRTTTTTDDDDSTLASDLWRLIVNSIGPLVTPRQRRALPRSAFDAARSTFLDDNDTYVDSVAYTEVPNVVRSLDWLQQHGLCLDQIAVQSLAATTHTENGGTRYDDERSRERTAVARRWMASGDLVAPAPLIHLSRQHAELLYVDAKGEPEGTVLWKGHQLLLNYCFGHASSSLLLFPYGPGVNLINHPDPLKNQTPNVALRWSSRMRHPEWLESNVSTLLNQTQHSGLLMEFYAVRDISPGDEILLDYGEAWTQAWDTHVRDWHRHRRRCTTLDPLVHTDTYTSAWDYLHECSRNVTAKHASDCFKTPPSWIDVRCWVATPAKLVFDSSDNDDEDWLLWHPPADDDEQHRTLDDTLSCQVLGVDQDGTYRIRVQQNHWSSVKNGVYVKHVPRSAFDFVDQPYTSNQFLRAAFRHEIQLPDDMIPQAWRDLETVPQQTDPSCGLYMAESSIPNSGLGIYSASNISKDEAIFFQDLVIHIEDFEMNAKLRHWANKDFNYNASFWLLDSYHWHPKTTMGNFDAEDIQSIIPGFGMMSNSHAAILNADVKAPSRFADLHRGEDPGAGSSTMYHGAYFVAAKDIEAGSELFVEYGNNWFIDRTESFGMIPLSADFVYADNLVQKLARIVDRHTERGGPDSEWIVEALALAAAVCSSRPRLANALPRDADSFRRAVTVGTVALSTPNRVRSPEWLESNGRCLDHIRPGQSLIRQAGRGAFATRPIRRGDRITTAPLVHLRRQDLELYAGDDRYDKEAPIWRTGSQLILNYCYGHAESSLLLFPYSPVVNYVNHNLTGFNAMLQWSTWQHHQHDWLERNPETVATEEHSGLIMELIAHRDIEAGEEIFLSYGPAWDDAWQSHVHQWSPQPEHITYTPAATLNERLEWIRTLSELSDDPYPVANHHEIATVCFVGSLKNSADALNSRGKPIQIVQWVGRENLFDTSDFAYPCVVVERHSTSYDSDHVYDRKDSIQPVDVTFQVVVPATKNGGGRLLHVNGVPRKAIRFFDSPYKSDDALRSAFRHAIHIPDDIFPEAWRDLKLTLVASLRSMEQATMDYAPSESSNTLPTKELIVAACREENVSSSSSLLVQIFESVVDDASSQRALSILTETVELIRTNSGGEKVMTTTTVDTANNAVVGTTNVPVEELGPIGAATGDANGIRAAAADAFANALTSAVWWLSCSISDLSSRTDLIAVIKGVLKAASDDQSDDTTGISTAAVTAPAVVTAPAEPVSFGLSEHLLRSIADGALLQTIGVLDGTIDLQKRLRVMNTSVNFRQHKFNLLSEETEGFSKFLYYLEHFWHHHPTNHNAVTLSSATTTTTTDVRLLHVLISTYSLDPNRCLDLTIDVLEYTIECIFLSQSTSSANNNKRDAVVAPTDSDTSALRQRRHWIRDVSNHAHVQFLRSIVSALSVTNKLAPLLGFKLQGRLSSAAVAATPTAPLTGTTGTSTASDSVTSLLRCMSWLCLSVDNDTNDGSPLLDAKVVIPYLPDESANISVLIQSFYLQTVQADEERIQSVGRVRLTSNEPTAVETLSVVLKPLEQLILMQWIQIFLQLQAYETIQSVLTPQEWSDLSVLFPNSIGVCLLDCVDQSLLQWSSQRSESNHLSMETDPPSVDVVLATISRPLAVVMESGCIVLRPTVYCKICRLLTSAIRDEKTTAANENLVAFLGSFLVPSLSVFSPSPAMSLELWGILEQLTYRVRYSLYASWKGGGLERASLQTTKPLWLIESELIVGKSARYALKRLSKDTISDMSRAVAKCCHSHPLVVFTTILNQIEAYDNLVQVMVDACRFVTPLSLDVLGFCILQRLSSTSGSGTVGRTQVKENGVNVAQWLQSLESFTGAFYKSFPHIELQGIMCYLMQRLKDGHVMELGVLRTLLKNCAGWGFADYAPAASLSSTQLEGRAGSTQLKRETMTFGVVSDMDLVASNQVRRVLQADNIGVSLLILLAQVRHQIVFQPSNSDRPIPVKLIGNLVDTSQVVMAILLDFLTNASDKGMDGDVSQKSALKKYSESLPPVLDLLNIYKLDVQSVWMLCRPLINSDSVTRVEEGALTSPYRSTIHLRDAALPQSAKGHLSVDLFECFFARSLYDICCPEDLYNNEIVRLEKEADRLATKLEKETDRHKQAPSVQPTAHPEKPPKEELDRVRKTAIELGVDLTKHKNHVSSQRDHMLSKTCSFFVSDQVSHEAAMIFFVRCIYPRCMQGPDDAMFCVHFSSFLHQNSTPGFGTLHYFDCAIVTLVRTLYCVTEGEAACASILLLEIWKTVSKWRYSETAFKGELAGKPGSFMVGVSKEGGERLEAVTPQAYEKLYNKWHAAIGSTCIGCLQSSEYMHLRCSLVVLTRLVEAYPTRPKLGNNILEALEPLQKESNAFADIRASAQAYSMQLIRSRDNGVWKEEDAATVEARLVLVEAAAAERQKKAEENMEQLKRDSDQITVQIGDYDSRDRNSRGRGMQAPGDNKGDDHRRGGNDNSRRRGGAQSLLSDPTDGGIRAEVRQQPQPRDLTQHNQPAPAERRHRERVNSYPSLSGVDATGGNRREETSSRGRSSQDDIRNLEGRWQKAGESNSPPRGAVTAGRKRSRPSSPAEQGETREEATSKRAKVLSEEDPRAGEDENPNRRSGQKRRTGSRR